MVSPTPMAVAATNRLDEHGASPVRFWPGVKVFGEAGEVLVNPFLDAPDDDRTPGERGVETACGGTRTCRLLEECVRVGTVRRILQVHQRVGDRFAPGS